MKHPKSIQYYTNLFQSLKNTINTDKETLNIFFLYSFLISSIIGSAITLILNYLTKNNSLLIVVNTVIFTGLILSLLILKIYKSTKIVLSISSFIVLGSILVWFFFSSGYYGGSTITILIVLGYMYSLILSNPSRLYSQIFIFFILVFLMIYQCNNLNSFKYVTNPTQMHILATATTFIILYLIIVISSSFLRNQYDNINQKLVLKQQELYSLNLNLEDQIVIRTASLNLKTKQLNEYQHKNAHELRGSFARIHGLLSLRKSDDTLSDDELFALVSSEIEHMGTVLQQISENLYKE